MDERTLRSQGLAMPVGRISLDVVEGPDKGAEVLSSTEQCTVGTAETNSLVLHDRTVSRFHVELSPSEGGIAVVDPGSTNGVFVGGVRLARGVVASGTLLRIGNTVLRVRDGATLDVALHSSDVFFGLRGRAPVSRRLMAQVARAANSDAAVLVIGESGTGKEVIARALHDAGARQKGPFVTVDCGSLSPTLVASELFGHEKGAFTGADRQRQGAFELAHGGTLFLDEIGELAPPLQANLLGVLERRRFKRLGGGKEINVDVRVISATHRDLRAEINRNAFRLDLFYRLAVVTLRVPPLRERPDDIALLFEHFLRQSGCDGALEEYVSQATLDSLRGHHWPGNVRELRNLVEATLALGEPPSLDPATESSPGTLDAALPYKEARAAVLDQFERNYLTALLSRSGSNVSKAAREAKMDRSHLIELLQRHRLR